jgi:choline dehydrogenase-like flavoprotein
VDAAVAGLDLRPARNVLAAPHPGGGARMGRDPSDSVVGYDHRVHDTDNLYISDPSVFPSPPSVDPSLTIMAFAYVAADEIAGAL